MKLEDWDGDNNTAVQEYFTDVASETGFFGVVPALLLSCVQPRVASLACTLHPCVTAPRTLQHRLHHLQVEREPPVMWRSVTSPRF